MSKLTMPKELYVEKMFAHYFSRKFYNEHKAEINSTSPYAVTDKLPAMRVVDNAIITGSGHISPIHSTPHYGFFGGYRGSSVSGGRSSWDINTKVQFDHISMCPVTGREFTDAELNKYHDDWIYRVEQHGRNEACQLIRSENLATQDVSFRYYDTVFTFNYADLESLQMQHRWGDNLVEFIEEHMTYPSQGGVK